MKKILSLMLVVAIMITSLTFVGCKKDEISFSLNGVQSNGGLGVIKDGYLYYINGGTTDLTSKDSQVVESASIYKRAVDSNGNPVKGEDPQIVYEGIAGFNKSKLYIFGEHLYFATPSTKVSNTANRLSKRTSFARIKLDGSDFEVLYTTETEEDIKYEYYVTSDTEMFLVAFEAGELYSVNFAKKAKKKVIAEEVTSVALTSTNGKGNGAEPFVFYTKSPSENYLTQNGNIVYRVTPDGKNNTKISSGENIVLNEINNGYLYFTAGTIMYKTTTAAGLDKSNIVSYVAYTKYMIQADGSIIGVDETNGAVVHVKWENGALVKADELMSSSSHTLMLADSTYLYGFNSSKIIYYSKMDGSKLTPAKLTGSAVVTFGSYLTYEKIGDYLYFFAEETVKDANGNNKKLTKLQALHVEEAIKKAAEEKK